MRPIHIIGVPLDLGGNRRGVDMGPSAFRIAGLGERIAALGYSLVDRGDLPAPIPETQAQREETKKYIRDIAKVCQKVYQTALGSLEEGALPLVLGGDHSLAAGSVAAATAWAKNAKELPIGLLWVDAHGDMNTPATSLSGNVHGMPLAALLGPEPSELARIGGISPKVLPAHTVIIGVRNLDEREKVSVRDSHVHVFTMKDIDREGIASVVEQAVNPRGQRHRRHPCVVRPGRLRSVDRARRRHAGQRRAQLPRSAHGDGDRRGLGPPHLARHGRSESDARRAERDGAAWNRARAVCLGNEDSVGRQIRPQLDGLASPSISSRVSTSSTSE